MRRSKMVDRYSIFHPFYLQEARNMAVAQGVSVFTVGVGTDAVLLNSLATVATEPACDHQLRVDQFQHLKDIIQETQFKICKGESCIHLDVILQQQKFVSLLLQMYFCLCFVQSKGLQYGGDSLNSEG